MRKQSIPKKSLQSNHYDFQVEQRPLSDADGNPSHVMGNYRTDTNECIGSTSKHYEIVNNGTVIEKVEQALERTNLGQYESEKLVTQGGSRFYGVYDFPAVKEKINVGDVVSMRLILNNSFDRSSGLSWSIGLRRLVCSNGMMSLKADSQLKQRHSANLKLDSITESVLKCATKFRESADMFRHLNDMLITEEQGVLILENLADKKMISTCMKDSITPIWIDETYKVNAGHAAIDHPRNMYNLYNAVTQHLTHNVAEHRFELSNRANRNVLSRLSEAANNDATFTKLTTRIPDKEKIKVDEVSLATN